MKKLISLMLAVILCIMPVFTACGGNSNTPTPNPPDPGPGGEGGGKRTTLLMQGFGDEEQKKEYESMVNGFNNSEYARYYGLFLTMMWYGEETYVSGVENGSTI